jgi:acyl-CoA synthetase (AMP-forming)/AMP-acid ligase II
MLLPAAGILIGYGSTEAAPAFCYLPLDPSAGRPDPRFHDRHRAAPLGLPGGDGEVKIAGPDGDPVPPGEVGEICLRGPAPQRRYHRDDAANARVFRAGWTHMGDLGRLDADGRLHFFDRATDVITTGGRRLSSLHVAGALMWHPEVVDAAAVALPHPELGEVVGAAVQLRSPVTDDRLRAFLADRLEPHEVPTHLRRFDGLPRGLTGKHGKARLRAGFAAAS